MAVTVNGMIAKSNGNVDFVSKANWRLFIREARLAGNMVMGRRTYDGMKRAGELKRFRGVRIIVVTSKPRRSTDPNVLFTSLKPLGIVKLLEKEGFKEALVTGGGILNASFMKSGVIDDLFLYVEPVVIGSGIGLFSREGFDTRLRLAGAKKMPGEAILLHYRVDR